jgi:hypothetical protein
MPDPVLLLSKDEQAVHVVSQVLAELSFTVERPADTTSAVSEIEKRGFIAILVDCDDPASGKAVFEAARRSNGNKQTPAIGIVSGRTGLPTAFRLGAGFVITKPASLDQARHALRAATSRANKNFEAQNITSVAPAPVLAKAAAATSGTSGDGKTLPATPTIDQPIPSTFSKSKTSSVSGTAAAATPALEQKSETQAPKAAPVQARPAAARKLEDDPVLADLDELENPLPLSGAPYTDLKLKRRTPVWALMLVLLLLAGAGGYAAFMMVPEFRNFVWAQYVQVRIMIGKPLPTPPPAAKPAPNPAPKPLPSSNDQVTGTSASETSPTTSPDAATSSQTGAAPSSASSGSQSPHGPASSSNPQH